MKYLLDTATFLWVTFDELEKIPAMGVSILQESKNQIYLSTVSVWEIAIKYSIGKLKLKMPPDKFVIEHAAKTDLTPLSITHQHALEVAKLPFHHKDPFDRLLIAQALAEEIPIMTPDLHFKKYGVEVIWQEG